MIQQLNLSPSQIEYIYQNTDLALALFNYLSFDNLPTKKEIAIWAIEYFRFNPLTQLKEFENQFLGISEGYDSEYDEFFWEDPNSAFPSQTLPSLALFEGSFPKRSDRSFDTPPKLYTFIGGNLLTKVGGSGAGINTCAARVSMALNYSGVKIPHIPEITFSGKDGKYYFLGAANLNRWMQKTFGCSNPNTSIGEYFTANSLHYNKNQIGTNGEKLKQLLQGINGIYSMVSNNFNWAAGHPDLIKSAPEPICDGACHFDGPVQYIDVWKLH